MSRVIVITGAGSGIGKGLSLKLASQGYSVIGIGRHLSSLEATQQAYPDNIKIIQADLTLTTDREKVITEILKVKKLISLVHNAATIAPLCSFKDISLEDWRNAVNLNLEAPLFLTQGLLSCLTGGRVLHISSGLAHYARLGMGVYCISKAALFMLYECCKKELRSNNIYVGSVMPGVVDTPMQTVITETSKEQLPGVQDFVSLKKNNQLVSIDIVADFLSWLLLDTKNAQFSQEEWDISDQDHHKYWLKNSKVILNWSFASEDN